jgi:RNA polymerase sigma factor (sigma-70 family)
MNFINYLNEISDIPRLTHQEEIEIGTIIQQNRGTKENPGTPEQQAICREAVAKLASANLLLVVKYANYYRRAGHDVEELTAEGNRGLMIAAEKYDPTIGTRFSTYATLWIQQSIRMAIHGSRTIRTPLRQTFKLDKVMWSNAYDPSRDEQDIAKLSRQTRLAPENIEKLLKYRVQLVPLSALIPGGDDEDTTTAELQDRHARTPLQATIPDNAPAPDGQMEDAELREMLREVLLKLPEMERVVLKSRFVLDDQPAQTLEEVAQVMGIKRDRVRKIQLEGVRMLQEEIQQLGYNISSNALIRTSAKSAKAPAILGSPAEIRRGNRGLSTSPLRLLQS